MAANNVYRVFYHFEKSGLRQTETFTDEVIVSATDKGSIFNVLNSNSKVPLGYTVTGLQITGMAHINANVLS